MPVVTVALNVQMFVLSVQRNVQTAPVIYVHIAENVKPALVTPVGAIIVVFAVIA